MLPVGVFFCHDIRLFKYLKSNKDWLISLSIDLTRIIQKEQRKLLEVLCLLALRHASRARMREEKNV